MGAVVPRKKKRRFCCGVNCFYCYMISDPMCLLREKLENQFTVITFLSAMLAGIKIQSL